MQELSAAGYPMLGELPVSDRRLDALRAHDALMLAVRARR